MVSFFGNITLYYLSLAQINDHMRWREELLEGQAKSLRQWRQLVEHDPGEPSMPIPLDKATDMPDIAHQAQHSIALEFRQRTRQGAARPHHYVMRQRVEQHDHLLGFEAFLVAFGDTQALLVVLDRRLDPPPRWS